MTLIHHSVRTILVAVALAVACSPVEDRVYLPADPALGPLATPFDATLDEDAPAGVEEGAAPDDLVDAGATEEPPLDALPPISHASPDGAVDEKIDVPRDRREVGEWEDAPVDVVRANDLGVDAWDGGPVTPMSADVAEQDGRGTVLEGDVAPTDGRVRTEVADVALDTTAPDVAIRVDVALDAPRDAPVDVPRDVSVDRGADVLADVPRDVLSCPPGWSLCNGRCVNLSDDPAHCGACNLACAALYRCINAACRLPCVDSCGCPLGTECTRGRCVSPSDVSPMRPPELLEQRCFADCQCRSGTRCNHSTAGGMCTTTCGGVRCAENEECHDNICYRRCREHCECPLGLGCIAGLCANYDLLIPPANRCYDQCQCPRGTTCRFSGTVGRCQ